MSMTGKACLLLPYIILEFLQLLAFAASIILTVGQHDDDGDGGRWFFQQDLCKVNKYASNHCAFLKHQMMINWE